MNRIYIIVLVLSSLFPFSSYSSCNTVNGKSYGNCSTTSHDSKQQGIIKVNSKRQVSGIIKGATIQFGGILNLSGISTGDVLVEKGGKLIVTGVVNGVIRNNGGTIHIEGKGKTIIANSGKTTIAGIVDQVKGSGTIKYMNGAIIDGQPIN
ncbi:MAG: hypothetical protein KAT04_08405 [Methylococcales bacterium]|nr:hypothetical protein [Methylococcales bacterium]